MQYTQRYSICSFVHSDVLHVWDSAGGVEFGVASGRRASANSGVQVEGRHLRTLSHATAGKGSSQGYKLVQQSGCECGHLCIGCCQVMLASTCNRCSGGIMKHEA